MKKNKTKQNKTKKTKEHQKAKMYKYNKRFIDFQRIKITNKNA